MNNKTIANLLKSAVKNSETEKTEWIVNASFPIVSEASRCVVVDGEKLKSKIQTIIEMLESEE